LLKVAVGIGATHVALGLFFGMINARQVLDRHAFCERLGQLLCLAGAALAAAALVGVGSPLLAAAGVCLLSGVAVLLFGAGLVALIEVLSLVSNILSYSRLMALGVASVTLAMVANRLFVQLDRGLAGLLAAAMLHALNILIAMFSPTIHTLRLHYVEFFTKFYRPGGKSYIPFGGRAESPG
jgi:V/A-type H+-transporting ATPase subunit I